MSNTEAVLVGGAISLVTSLLTSWWVAERYFQRQRDIDHDMESKEVGLAFKRLVHAYFPMLNKRPKLPSAIRLAMDELEAKLKIYRPDWDPAQMQKDAITEAMQLIEEHPQDFEDE